MRCLLFFCTALLLMTACSTDSDNALEPIRVEIERTEDGYRLLRGGEPYIAKGAGMAINDIERFAAAGGNSIRNWSTAQDGQDTGELLDDAHAHGVTVALGLAMQKERHGFDYDDPEAVAAQLERMREEVLKYRDHPAVLVWVIGNELDLSYENPRVWDAVNDVAEMIDELDPFHPTTTTTAGFNPEVNAEILARAPALDFLSFQMYSSIFTFPERLDESGFDGPFMVTEWGTIGWWEVGTTDWGAPIEVHSSEKADTFRRGYQGILEPLEAQLLGSYAFDPTGDSSIAFFRWGGEAAGFLDCNLRDAGAPDSGELLAGRIIGLMRNTGAPNGLAGVGFAAEDVPALAQSSARQARAIKNAPRETNLVDIENIYAAAISY